MHLPNIKRGDDVDLERYVEELNKLLSFTDQAKNERLAQQEQDEIQFLHIKQAAGLLKGEEQV